MGYVCGYIEAWYLGSEDPHNAALLEASAGAVIGGLLGPVIGLLPAKYQLWTGIGLGIFAAATSQHFAVFGMRATCMAVEFGMGGGFRNLKDIDLKDLGKSIKNFLADEAGSLKLPRGPKPSVDPKITAGRKAVVLGEGMAYVKDAARRLQSQGVKAKWYQAWGKNFPKNRPMTRAELDAALARNEAWIRSKIKEGYVLFDIGVDPTRSVRSPFYDLEQRIIKELGAQTILFPRAN
jgi:hypothetical protein